MSVKALTTLDTTPALHFCTCYTNLYNKTEPFAYYRTLKEEDFYFLVDSSPDAFDVGEWTKNKIAGYVEYFTLPNDYKFRIWKVNNNDVEVALVSGNNSVVYDISATISYANGTRTVNHSGILVLFIDRENHKAVLQYLRDVRARGTTDWAGDLLVVNRVSPSYPFSDTQSTALYQAIMGVLPPEPFEPVNSSHKGGGRGTWTQTSDTVALPDIDTLNLESFAKSYFLTTYRMTYTELNSLSEIFWSHPFIEKLKEVWYASNPMESIIGLTMIPLDSVGNAHDIIIGGFPTGVSSHVIGNQFVNLDCGELEIPEKWGGALDYISGVSLYLPYIGVQALDTAEVMGSRLHINYYVDVISGACIAFVRVIKEGLNSVLYHFTGNCAYSLPLSKNDFTSTFNSLVGATASAVGAVATGGASAGIMATVGAGSSLLTSCQTHTQHSGSLGGNTGIMGSKKPYVIIHRPIQSLPLDFGKFRGYPSNITETLSSLKGFTKVKEIHLDNVGATDAEKAEIEQLLKSGVIIK